MVDELQNPFVGHVVVKPTNVRIQDPLHRPPLDRHIQRIQRLMRPTPRPKPVRESQEVLLVNLFEDPHHRLLNDLVLQGGDAQRTSPPVGLRDVDSSRGLSPVRASMDTTVKIGQPILQVLLVLPPCHPVHSGRGLPLKGIEALPKKRYRDMVKQGREANLLIPSRGFAYSPPSLGHAGPALSRGHVGQQGVLLGLRPSLPNLRGG